MLLCIDQPTCRLMSKPLTPRRCNADTVPRFSACGCLHTGFVPIALQTRSMASCILDDALVSDSPNNMSPCTPTMYLLMVLKINGSCEKLHEPDGRPCTFLVLNEFVWNQISFSRITTPDFLKSNIVWARHPKYCINTTATNACKHVPCKDTKTRVS